MRTRVLILILLIVNITVLPGCWNYREVNMLSIIAGMAIDKDETGKYHISVEIVDMHEGGRDTKIRSKILETKGETLFDAIRNALKITSPKLYFGHTEIVVISQEVAREGILEILDLLSRDAEPRLSINLLISQEKTAKEILSSQSITTSIRSFELNDMLSEQKSISKYPRIQVYQFINALSSEGISPVLPAVRLTVNEGQKTSKLSGTAVFKGDKLIGFLDDTETEYFLFVTDKVKGGVLVLKDTTGTNNVIAALEIFENKTKVKPIYSNGKVSISITTKTKVALDEQATRVNLIDRKGRTMLETNAKELIKENMEKVIHKVQKDFDTDIFGFGMMINENMPALWKGIKHDWNTIFKDLDFNVNTTVEVRHSGLMSNSIKIGGNQ